MRARITVVGSVYLSGQDKLLRLSHQPVIMVPIMFVYDKMLGLTCGFR